jgi:hypothetical protein
MSDPDLGSLTLRRVTTNAVKPTTRARATNGPLADIGSSRPRRAARHDLLFRSASTKLSPPNCWPLRSRKECRAATDLDEAPPEFLPRVRARTEQIIAETESSEHA